MLFIDEIILPKLGINLTVATTINVKTGKNSLKFFPSVVNNTINIKIVVIDNNSKNILGVFDKNARNISCIAAIFKFFLYTFVKKFSWFNNFENFIPLKPCVISLSAMTLNFLAIVPLSLNFFLKKRL